MSNIGKEMFRDIIFYKNCHFFGMRFEISNYIVMVRVTIDDDIDYIYIYNFNIPSYHFKKVLIFDFKECAEKFFKNLTAIKSNSMPYSFNPWF